MLIEHSTAKANAKTTAFKAGYIWAGNGIFRSASRTEFKAVVLHDPVKTPGLRLLKQDFQLLVPPLPEAKVQTITERILKYPNLEQLFYLYWKGNQWEVVYPEQECTPNTCISLETYPEPAVIEIHSHGSMNAFFSVTDNREETGFRVSSVIGRNQKGLEIISRVCVHGLFLPISSNLLYNQIDKYCSHATSF